MAFPRAILRLVVVSLAACTGQIQSAGWTGEGSSPPGQSSEPGQPSEPGDPSDPSDPSDPNEPDAPTCVGEPRPSASVLRRLTPTEYRNTVRDMFPGADMPDVILAPDARVGGFDNNVEGQTVSDLLTRQYFDAAVAIGAQATASLAAWAPCTTNDAGCAAQITELVATRAARRPPSAEDLADFIAFVEITRAESGLEDATAALLEALLVSPEFLYRPELGAPDMTAPSGLLALDDYEVASRLSYLLWRTLPDATLLDAAARGELTSDTDIEREARRMLADPRARETIADLHAQWFELARIDTLALAPSVFPAFDSTLRDDLKASLARYLDDAFWTTGTVAALFDGTYGYVNDRLAPVFGVESPGTATLTRVELDPTQRAGVLTQPGWLAYRAHETVHSSIFRGTFVLEHVLCAPTPSAPPGAETMNAPLPPGEVVTNRERVTRSHTGACTSCHERIDGIGFAFENYDALGQFRTTETELNLPIDASGIIIGTSDADGAVRNAVELSHRIAQSQQVEGCVVDHYARYTFGRKLSGDGDECQVEALRERLHADGGDLEELVVAIITSPSFRFRTAPTL